eukprot:7906045-Pyramimonas_sp.AAC.1
MSMWCPKTLVEELHSPVTTVSVKGWQKNQILLLWNGEYIHRDKGLHMWTEVLPDFVSKHPEQHCGPHHSAHHLLVARQRAHLLEALVSSGGRLRSVLDLRREDVVHQRRGDQQRHQRRHARTLQEGIYRSSLDA